MVEASLSIGRQRVGAFKKSYCAKKAFKRSYTVECRNRLRVGVRAKNASVLGFVCRPFQGHVANLVPVLNLLFIVF